MKPLRYNEQQLLQACSVLFGPHVPLSAPFLHYIELSGVKSAYRNRVKETHPDTRPQHNLNPPEFDFFQVQQAYQHLCQFLSRRPEIFASCVTPPPPSPAPRPTPRRRSSPNQPQVRKDGSFLPHRQMMLGEFLCYSGYCSWNDIHQALAWQRRSRPRLGEICRNFGWLEQQDIFTILTSTPKGGRFGHTATRLGLLTQSQVEQILRHQRVRQPRLGQFFLHQHLLSPQQLQNILWHLSKHNFLMRR